MLRVGGVETVFPRGSDIFPYLKRNRFCIFIRAGFLDMRISTPKVEAYELVTFTQGTFLSPEFLNALPAFASCELLAAGQPLEAVLLPSLKNLQSVNAKISPINFQTLFVISTLNTTFFHTGSGMQRVCDYLWHYDLIRKRNPNIPSITQDKILHKTLLSQSQLTRVLASLREKKLIRTTYRNIDILNYPELRQYVTPAMCELSP